MKKIAQPGIWPPEAGTRHVGNVEYLRLRNLNPFVSDSVLSVVLLRCYGFALLVTLMSALSLAADLAADEAEIVKVRFAVA
jgi:hypothetical protein